MKKPYLDEFDRWIMRTDNVFGRSIKRRYKLIKLKKKYFKI